MRDSARGQTAIVALTGELDIATAPRLEQEVGKLDRGELAQIVLDFRNLAFIDSTGLRMVLGIAESATVSGTRLVLLRGSEAVQRVLALTGADRELLIVDELEQGT